MRHTPLLKEYLLIIELSLQRFTQVFTEIRHKQLTEPHSPSDIRNHYRVSIRNKFDKLQETSEKHTLNANMKTLLLST